MSTKIAYLIGILTLCVMQNAMAQYDPEFKEEAPKYDPKIDRAERAYWFEGGLGLVGEEMGYQASINYQVNRRFMVAAAFDRADYFFGKPETWILSNSLSIEGGFILKSKSLIGYLTIGPSYTWGTTKEDDAQGEEVGYSSTNLKFKMGCIVRKYYLGVSPFFHFNSRNAYAGITLNVVIGKHVKS